MATRMTSEELMEHAQECFMMSQLASHINNFVPSPKTEAAIKGWYKAGKRAEYRADCIWCGKGDPAFIKERRNEMKNPWLRPAPEGCPVKEIQSVSVEDRKLELKKFDVKKMKAVIAWPETQKSVRIVAERRLKKMQYRRYYNMQQKRSYHKYILPPGSDDLIRKTYQEEVRMGSVKEKGNSPVRNLCKRLGVPRWKVSRRAMNLGLINQKKKEPAWSEEELRILKRNSRFTPETIARKLREKGFSRSCVGILLKRKRMRFLQDLGGQSANMLAECFGVDRKTVGRWIHLGYLKAAKRETKRVEKQGGDISYIKDAWVRYFILNYLDIIDIRKVDKYWFVDLLCRGEMR